jgi:hypothetical protein
VNILWISCGKSANFLTVRLIKKSSIPVEKSEKNFKFLDKICVLSEPGALATGFISVFSVIRG